MRNDSFGNDPRTIWQNQPTEPSAMTLEKIRQKVRELHAKTRQKLLGGIAVSLLVAGISGYGIAAGDGPVVRAIFVLAIVWSFWVGLIILLIGLIAFGGFARGKWY